MTFKMILVFSLPTTKPLTTEEMLEVIGQIKKLYDEPAAQPRACHRLEHLRLEHLELDTKCKADASRQNWHKVTIRKGASHGED